MNIRTKLFWTNGAVVVVLIASLTFFLETYARKSILGILKENAGHSVAQLAENVDSLLRSYEQIADYVYMDDLLQDRLLRRFDSYPDAHEAYLEYVKPQLAALTSSRDVLDLAFYSDNATFHVGSVKPLSGMTGVPEWSACSSGEMKADSVRVWTSVPGQPDRLRLTQRLNHLNPRSCLFLQIDLDAGLLNNLIKKESEKSRFLVVMPNGVPVLDSMAGIRADGDVPIADLLGAEGGRVVRAEGIDYLPTMRALDSRRSVHGIRVASLVPLGELEARTKTIRTTAFLFFVFALALFVVVNYVVSGRITRRLRQLAAMMRSTDMDRLRTIRRIEGRDEVSLLGHTFNGMVLRMQRLIREVYESELTAKELQLKTKEAELYALQTQINPHYLYNTLNSIRGSLLEKGDRESAEIVGLLAKSFRHMLGKSGGMIPLGEELAIVETYLKIQAFRYSDRLTYRIEVPDRLRKLDVPKLSLQTLVENAIVHGVEPNGSATTVTVTASEEEDAVRLSVEDDGPGIGPERLAEVAFLLSEDASNGGERHIGLSNVHRRLRSFGEPFGVRLESEPGKGVKATLLVPLSPLLAAKEVHHV
ncbi:sensor histidine kinase [Paenibacillus flagellatus]|uniref:histidine kinase n=1 Tax=Paenibacillus flagellatus TaxID=2211139 RepID=A0A2V5L2Y9_9BACL|nr:histidine kinase [Paenibacillus flagellatus]PYI57126.1 hypothetical protein DLM86_01380 [Paenibacillus flagellatus]